MRTVVAAVAGAIATLVVLAAAVPVVAYGGLYDVAATEEHASVTRWAFDTTFRNSVARRALPLSMPDPVPAEAVAAGAAEYKEACQHCHAGPGVERAEWAAGMRPRPPHLAEAAAEWEAGEIFWIVKHGVKMSGMPAFGPSHADDELWNVVAFVRALPGMTAEEYAATGGGGHGHGHGDESGG